MQPQQRGRSVTLTEAENQGEKQFFKGAKYFFPSSLIDKNSSEVFPRQKSDYFF
jgi:hypothetical protein